MKLTKAQLRQTIEEELASEGFFDSFTKKGRAKKAEDACGRGTRSNRLRSSEVSLRGPKRARPVTRRPLRTSAGMAAAPTLAARILTPGSRPSAGGPGGWGTANQKITL